MSRWINLSDRAKFRLSGPDRVRYLNGQVSNQVDQDLSKKAIAACVCNLKGKIEGLISIADVDGHLMIDAPAGQRESLFLRLDRYLIADDCELEDVTDEFQLWHCLDDDDDDGENRAGILSSNRFGISGTDHWSAVDEAFSPNGDLLGADEAEFLRIQNGIPKWGNELTGDEFPAELGLDKTAVDFHKGCYLGQEIVSRIESVGKVKRMLVGLASDSDEYPLEAGAEVEFEGKRFGEITSVASKGSEFRALAVVKRTFTELVDGGIFPESLSVKEFS